MTAHQIARQTVVAGLLLVGASPAFADVIDGDWCSADARHFRISGANITTPAGTQTTGTYSRHAFSYIVPDGDPGAGEAIHMLLLNEEAVRVIVNSRAPETWHRCQLNV